jgi:hypothetical protein
MIGLAPEVAVDFTGHYGVDFAEQEGVDAGSLGFFGLGGGCGGGSRIVASERETRGGLFGRRQVL